MADVNASGAAVPQDDDARIVIERGGSDNSSKARRDPTQALEAINRRWPDLSFRDFWGAYVLAQALAMPTEGRA